MKKRSFPLLFLVLAFITGFVSAANTATDDSRMNSKTFKGLEFRNIGPALMSGRIADIAIHPKDQGTWYIAVGSGGVWKTTNAGNTWKPVFDEESSYSIGCVAIDAENPEVVWVGTGENVSGRHVGYGDGVYKSLNGGESWTRMGLETSEHIGEILIDPRDSNVVFVAAEGSLWKSGGDRGVYRSADGGKSWNQALAISPETGVTHLEFDPGNPDVIYAAAYQRRRSVPLFLGGGPESGIYKSTDGGDSWRRIEKGLPEGDMGRIGLAVSPVKSNYVYATIEAGPEEKGFYRSTDSGESWEKRSDYTSGGTGAHYYQEIFASPHKLDRVYQMDVWLHITEDGGKSFTQLGEPAKHSDNHALAFNPQDPDYLLAGSDGGLYETWDHGKNWRFVANLPVTQFYKIALDNDFPFYNIVGGTQDNATQLGPSRTLNVHGIRNQDWIITLGGDGHGCQLDPEDPNIVYSESQVGELNRIDKKTGERLDIVPQPGPNDPPERFNWDAPILISPHSHTRLYFGSQRIWKSDDRGDSWTPISEDLTRNQNRYELEVQGRVWSVDALYDHGAMSIYNSTTSISESPIVEGLIYVGTDDGLIQVTENGGNSWRRVDTLPGVPGIFYVNEVKASATDADVVFAAVDNHKAADYSPYLLKSSDRGRTWASITGDLPERHLVWSIVQDHVSRDLLFAGTEFGIFFTVDGGQHWIKLTGGVPTISFRDLEIQRRENDLVGGSFGRSFFILDDYTPLRGVTESMLESEMHLFPVKKTLLYIPQNPLGWGEKADQGAAYFTAPNPPFGAIFTYYLADELKTGSEKRREREKQLRSEEGDVPFPGYQTLREESREGEPKILFTIRDRDNKVVRRITGPTKKGFHRVAWDLRYPSFEPIKLDQEGFVAPWDRPTPGPLALPGRYTVSASKLVNGEQIALGEEQSFEVVPLEGSTLPIADRTEVLRFQQETANLLRVARGADKRIDELEDRLRHMEEATLQTPGMDAESLQDISAMSIQLSQLSDHLGGDSVRQTLSEPALPGIIRRLTRIVRGHWGSTYGPTETNRRTFEIAKDEFASVQRDLKKVEAEMNSLEGELETAGAPWTPQRQIP